MQVYYNILEMIRTQLLGDVNVNTVTTGDIFDVDLDKQTIFPLSHVMVNQATRKDRVYTLNISVLLMDIVDKVNHEATDKFRGNDNEQDVFNTQLSVGGRLVEMLKRGDLRDDNFELTNDPNFEPFTERFENSLAGWALTFDVDVPNTMTVCDVPIVPPSCLAADYSIIDEDGNVLYSGSIASGGSLEQEIQNSTAIVKNSDGTTQSTTSILAEGTETITANDALIGLLNSAGTVIGGDSFPSGTTGSITAPDADYVVKYENGTVIESGSIPSSTSKDIEVPNPSSCDDATVENSDLSYISTVASGDTLVLPDIPNVDSDGLIVNTPAQVPFICTPSVGANLLNLRTGQTTSYRTGDDANVPQGREVDFLTLSDNNPFGNTNRFTDVIGGSTYANGVALDWAYKDDVNQLVIGWQISDNGGNIDWNGAIDYCEALTLGTYSDWHLPNDQLINSLRAAVFSRTLSYPPFNNSSNVSWWSSTSMEGVLPTYATTLPNRLYGTLDGINKTVSANMRAKAYRIYTYAELGL